MALRIGGETIIGEGDGDRSNYDEIFQRQIDGWVGEIIVVPEQIRPSLVFGPEHQAAVTERNRAIGTIGVLRTMAERM